MRVSVASTKTHKSKFRFIVLFKITFVGGGAFDAPKPHCKIPVKRDGQRPSPTISFDKLLDKSEFILVYHIPIHLRNGQKKAAENFRCFLVFMQISR